MRILVFIIIALLLIVMGIILGDYGPWYFAWLLGTVMIVLVSAAGGALMDTQLEDDEPKH